MMVESLFTWLGRKFTLLLFAAWDVKKNVYFISRGFSKKDASSSRQGMAYMQKKETPSIGKETPL